MLQCMYVDESLNVATPLTLLLFVTVLITSECVCVYVCVCAAIQELHDWLVQPDHKSEVILIMIDDYAADKDWGRQDLIWGPIHDIMGDMILTQSLKKQHFPNSW